MTGASPDAPEGAAPGTAPGATPARRRPAEPRVPVFLARRSYRRRRMMDACRMLPVLGAALWLMPILWKPAATAAGDTAPGIVYVFGVWVLLVLAVAALARGLVRALEDGDGEGG